MGPAIIVVVLVIAIPVAVLLSASIAAAILGTVMTRQAEADHPGSELIPLNK